MNNEIKETIESAAERYADDIIKEVESTAYLTPPEKEAWRKLLADGYFQGAAEMLEVIRDICTKK